MKEKVSATWKYYIFEKEPHFLILQVPSLLPGSSATTLLPMALFQNLAPGPPNSVLQVAVKNNQQPVWYFTDKVPLQALFLEDGKMERSTFLEVWNIYVSFLFIFTYFTSLFK